MTTKYNPFEDMERLFDRLSRQFGEVSHSWEGGEGFGGLSMSAESARVNLVDEEDALVATVDLPGFEVDDVDVQVSNHSLIIEAEREEEEEAKEKHYLRRERRQRSVHRTIELPEEIDDEAVTARMKHGVLTIRLPKQAVEKAHSVDITIE